MEGKPAKLDCNFGFSKDSLGRDYLIMFSILKGSFDVNPTVF